MKKAVGLSNFEQVIGAEKFYLQISSYKTFAINVSLLQYIW